MNADGAFTCQQRTLQDRGDRTIRLAIALLRNSIVKELNTSNM